MFSSSQEKGNELLSASVTNYEAQPNKSNQNFKAQHPQKLSESLEQYAE